MHLGLSWTWLNLAQWKWIVWDCPNLTRIRSHQISIGESHFPVKWVKKKSSLQFFFFTLTCIGKLEVGLRLGDIEVLLSTITCAKYVRLLNIQDIMINMAKPRKAPQPSEDQIVSEEPIHRCQRGKLHRPAVPSADYCCHCTCLFFFWLKSFVTNQSELISKPGSPSIRPLACCMF